MEEKSKSTFKFNLTYGLITGAAVIILSLIFYVLELPFDSPIVKYAPFLIFIGGMVYGAHMYKNEFGNGFMTYGKAFGTSYLIGIYAAILASIYGFIYMSYIDPGIINQILEVTEQTLLDQGNMTDAQIDQALELTKKIASPGVANIMGLVWYAVILAIVSLITSIFVKNEEEI